MSKLDKRVYEVMDRFDFGECLRIMEAIDWKWYVEDGNRIPNEDELKDMALRLLNDVVDDEGIISTGGFTALNRGGNLYLFFGIDSF